jgi:hypothetical protein
MTTPASRLSAVRVSTRFAVSASLLLAGWGLLPAPAAADALADLKTALSRLDPQPIEAKVDVDVEHQGRAFLSGNSAHSDGKVKISADRRGIKLGWGYSHLASSWRWSAWPWQGLSHSGDEHGSLLELPEAAAILDYRPLIDEWLGRATLLEEGADAYAGQPAWKLVLRLALPDEGEWMHKLPGGKKPENLDELVKIWVDPNGVPLGFERQSTLDLGQVLSAKNQERRTFAVTHGRLVTVDGRQEVTVTGLAVFRGTDIKRWKVDVK